jgi:hypothetical protein
MIMDREIKRKKHYQRSYFGPILLIVVGILFLGSNLGVIPSGGWGVIWRLWPLLLIVAGLDDLIRGRGIAWPILLISAGAFLLYNNFGPQSWISWTQLFQLWPIILIAFGIDVLFRGQSGWMIATGIILAIAVIGGAFWLFSNDLVIPVQSQAIRESYTAEIDNGDIEISLGMGELILGDSITNKVLIEGNIAPDKKVEDQDITGNTIVYSLKNTQPELFPHTSRWELVLTRELSIDLSVNNGVGELFLALENLELKSLEANQGVGRLVVRLPGNSASELLVKQAVGSILIQIPSDSLVAIDAQNGLSKVNFPPDFELENGYYSSPGATEKNADLLIVVEQAIGLVSIEYNK